MKNQSVKNKKNSKIISDNKSAKNKKGKEKSRIASIFSRLMPYILAVLFVVMLFTLVGELAFSRVLYGLFSTFASYFILVFLLYHALMWYYDTKRKICVRRVCCSFIIVISVAMLQHVLYIGKSDFVYKATEALSVNKPSIFQLYDLGKDGTGGGVIGGGLCGLLLSTVGKGFTIAIILVLLTFMFLQMFNITPVSIIQHIFREKIEAKKAKKEAAKRRAQLAKKHKRFNVFDDADDMVAPQIDERILQAMNENAFDEQSTATAHAIKAEELDDTFEIERKPVSEAAQTNMPLQRSASPYRFSSSVPDAQKVEKADINAKFDDTDTDEYDAQDAEYTDEYEDNYEELIEDEPDYEDEDEFTEEEDGLDEDVEDEEFEDSEDEISDTDEIGAPDTASYANTSSVSYVTEKADSDEAPTPKEKKPLFSGIFKKDKAGEPKEEKKEEKMENKKNEAASVSKPPKKKKKYIFPPIDIFEKRNDNEDSEAVNEELEQKSKIIIDTLKSFNINARILNTSRGPTVTRYELMPEAGVKVRSIANLVDDIALYLAAEGIRMECPIPGKSAVGIEVPNSITSTVYLRSLLEDPKFKQAKSPVTCAVGKSISGENVYVDIAKLVHLLVAGATGQGKSVCINSLLVSLLYKASPEDLRIILIDPKRVEFAPYNGIPHLLVPVVTDVKKSVGTLQWSVSEMERRFELLEYAGVRDIGEYNERVDRGTIGAERIPRIVIVIDELYDLKMQVPEIDDYIIRLTQKARAAGIHVIIGTQRPSVDVITGVIKANIPSRIAFRVPAQVDSRTILDEVGAEKLVARGDMLLKPVGALKPIRVQGAFITEDEREMVTNFLKENSSENYDEEVINQIDNITSKLQKAEKRADSDGDGDDGEMKFDDKFFAALEIATDSGKVSSSNLMRKLGLGFQRASKIIDQMEELGYIGEANGSKPRDVLITKQDYLELRMKYDEGN